MNSPVQVVEDAYERYARGDFAGVFALLSPSIEVEQTGLLPWGGRHVGHDGARRFFAILGEYTDAKPKIERMVDAGSDIAAIGRLVGSARKTGRKIDLDIVHVWRIEDSEVVRFAAYIDTPAMLQALKI